jgi:Ni,Fe-hydrogenase III large subunit/Ni,Fe-hydrogenase III component G
MQVIPGVALELQQLPAPLPIWHAGVSAEQWRAAAQGVAAANGRLVALWGAARADTAAHGASVCAAYAVPQGLAWLELALDAQALCYPDLAPHFPAAARMQRAGADLLGLVAEGAADRRPWLDHGVWPPGYRPLRSAPIGALALPDTAGAAGAAGANRPQPADYPFVRVEGDGVHEIAVGPVHAGIIEPGHFRFSVVGEKVLRLEQRLGYVHKGIGQRFTQLGALQAHRLAGRVSGDSTVAFAWAYCMALESAAGCTIPQRAQQLRALMLERERIANHLGDLGAIGNDAGLGIALAQFSRLREDWQRLSMAAFGHRLMMDNVVPGGVSADLAPALAARMIDECDAIESELKTLRRIYDEHAGLQDRFMGTGTVSPQLAEQLGLSGLAGRASGRSADLRCDHPWPPYQALQVRRATQRGGDVAARVDVRFDEAFESLRLIRLLCAGFAPGPVQADVELPARGNAGAGWIEGWRGEVFVALVLGPGGAIRHCHCHDPSWHNWPVLEHAVIGNIVPDFPLINKSFNLSYSGHDL